MTAEKLFAEKGIEGVSLRTIGLVAGQGNSVAVQYHFKNRAGLISAILSWRWVRIEEHRKQLLIALLEEDRKIELADLIRTLTFPLLDVDCKGDRNHFVRFLMHYLTSSDRWSNETSYGVRAWFTPFHNQPNNATIELLDLIAKELPHIPQPYIGRRLTHSLRMMMGTVVYWENAATIRKNVAPLEVLIEDQISMIVAAMSAPVPQSSIDRLPKVIEALKSGQAP